MRTITSLLVSQKKDELPSIQSPPATTATMGRPSCAASLTRALSLLPAGILLISALTGSGQAQQKTADAPAPLRVLEGASLSTDFSKIAREVGPAVVNINTETLPHRAKQTDAQDEDEGDDDGNQAPNNDMQNFFNQFFGGPSKGNQEKQEERALGSGFIVDSHGYIVTNEHLIHGADRIFVKLSTDPHEDQGHRATLIGADKDTDLAVIKINVDHPLPTVKMGNAETTQVGEWVEAIGSPFDLSQTVTTGIVSAKNRDIAGPIGGQFKHYIQTDAAINMGNSGGPLLNMNGEVIGVNTALLSESSGYMGIGFAMPSNTVVSVYNQLVGPEHKVVRGSLGISFQPHINSAVAKVYNAGEGVLVTSVVPGKAAEKAGIKTNDVIVSIDGKPVKNGDALLDDISPRRPGSTVTLGYLRNGQKMSTTCTIEDRTSLEDLASQTPNQHAPGKPDAEPGEAKLGVTVRNLPGDAPSQFHGVLVQSVVPGSFADELDPPVGPSVVIESINRTPIHNKAEFDALTAKLHTGDNVALEIAYPNSGGQTTLTGGTLH